MSDLDERLDKAIADCQERILASLPTEKVAEMYRQMKAEQAASTQRQLEPNNSRDPHFAKRAKNARFTLHILAKKHTSFYEFLS